MTSTARLADAKATKPRHGDPNCNGCGLCCLAELPAPRVGWALVTAALDPDAAALETIARLYEGHADATPCDVERRT